ncbi:hypothetical protein AVEN_71358-1 [Araneus ventricosus]|uniref:Uncharacterized protein n=1 Tax=Araneus ventricosus TaxID=182803 RepID=A0A4Y2BKM4_ARAVE|nr:hypothetical protein AVEN_71358-1 [Araneus ventricosus]
MEGAAIALQKSSGFDVEESRVQDSITPKVYHVYWDRRILNLLWVKYPLTGVVWKLRRWRYRHRCRPLHLTTLTTKLSLSFRKQPSCSFKTRSDESCFAFNKTKLDHGKNLISFLISIYFNYAHFCLFLNEGV